MFTSRRLLMVAALALGSIGAIVIGGCASREGGVETSSSAAAALSGPAESGGGGAGAASPIESYKEARLTEAMRGLTFDTGFVVIDEAAARAKYPKVDAAAARAEFERGRALLYESNIRIEAIGAFRNAVMLDSANAEYYEALGRAFQTRGMGKEAIASYRTALRLEPGRVTAMFQTAEMLGAIGRHDEALAAWGQVVAADARNGEARARYSIALYYAGDYGGAWREFHAAEGLGHAMPGQFRPLLEGKMVEPGGN